MRINVGLQKLIAELQQARTKVIEAQDRVLRIEGELQHIQSQIVEGMDAIPKLPRPRKKRSDAGISKRDKSESLTDGGKSDQQVPSESKQGESSKPTTRRARKGKEKIWAEAGEIVRQAILDKNAYEDAAKAAAKLREQQHLSCPSCPKDLKDACPLDGTQAIDCWEARNKK